MPNNFETLPNEILVEIFKYTNAFDVCRGFHQLNYRIESVLRSVALRVNISVVAEHKLRVILPFAVQVEALCIISPPAPSFQTRPASHVDLYPFVQLRSLTLLCDTDEQQAKQLCTERFEYLTYLRLPSFTPSVLRGSYQPLMEKIFSNGFPALRVCHLPRAMRPRNVDSPSSPTLRVIELGASTFTVLAEILTCAPNATRVAVNDLGEGAPIPLVSKSLTHLKLAGGSEMSLEAVNRILSNLSKLKQLSVTALCYYANLNKVNQDFIVLNNIISTKVRHPTGFGFNFKGISNDIPIEQVKQLLQTFPALNCIRCQPLWSNARRPGNIDFILSCP